MESNGKRRSKKRRGAAGRSNGQAPANGVSGAAAGPDRAGQDRDGDGGDDDQPRITLATVQRLDAETEAKLAKALDGVPPFDYLSAAIERFSEERRKDVRDAYHLGALLHQPQRRRSGGPYYTHCVEVARRVASICPEPNAIIAALLHDALEDTSYAYAQMATDFPGPVADIVEGVTKLENPSEAPDGDKALSQGRTLRKMMIAAGKDIRVIIVKLCDRLHNMATLEAMPPHKRRSISAETLEIYAPIAHMLGMTRIRAELEDMAMRHLYPLEYRDIATRVAKRKSQREEAVNQMIDRLSALMASNGIEGRLLGRPKHFYSIWQKMQRQGVPFDEVYDLIALRAIVTTVEDIYKLLGIVHNWFPPVNGRFRDYLNNPKPNGYRSVHTTVHAPWGGRAEIQIRTEKMHETAENGIAAHWLYKYENGADLSPKNFDSNLLDHLRDTADTLQGVDASEVVGTLHTDFFHGKVLVHTPRGEPYYMAEGSTALDFAYRIHSEIGDRCSGAKINGRIVSLDRKLQSGDTIVIITNKNAHPTSNWLKIAQTQKAKVRIKQWLKRENHEENIERGRAALLQAVRAAKLGIAPGELESVLSPIVERSKKWQSIEDIFERIGYGSATAASIVDRLRQERARAERAKKAESAKKAAAPKIAQSSPENLVLVDGVAGMVTRIARCCRPVEGEDIVGFVRRDGVMIHRKNCATLARHVKQPGSRQKVVPCSWRPGTVLRNRKRLRVHAHDREGLLADLTQILREGSIFIVDFRIEDRLGGEVTLRFDIASPDSKPAATSINRLRSTESVKKVQVS